ncbi:MAG TPA: hypothetical protein VE604_12770 [Candidatus Polarisedimenticolia bacterium]|jgi:hypothetical protein|nr:hypothetical protein [Candidatus Polarisedimenticolia bacterium]
MANLFAIHDAYHLVFPGLLLVFYVVCWLALGRDPEIGNIAPRYEPPAGISAGVARYILTGGSDGTTLAAVLTGLAAKGVVSIQPKAGSYTVTLLNSSTIVLPDEASVVRTLFNVVLTVQPYADSNTAILGDALLLKSSGQANSITFRPESGPVRSEAISADRVLETGLGAAVGRSPSPETQVVIDPLAAAAIKGHLDALQDTFRKNLQGIYFRQNFRYAGMGMAATFAWALFTAATLEAPSSMFITFWLLLFTSIAGLVIGGVWTSKPTHPSPRQRVTRVILPVLFFGLPGSLIYVAALPQSHGFVLALLLSVLLNNIFFVIMRAPTPRGFVILQQLAGFREFLVRVEQDQLDRVNTPEQRTELMNRFLPYAIALKVREGWGDKLASAFSDAIVER